jgi:hypothetical protein
MSLEITDSVNYYRWEPGSNGSLVLGYQLGGNDNFSPILGVNKTGNLSSAALKKTTAAADTDSPVFVMTDKDGVLLRDYNTMNTINSNFTTLQNQVNTISQASTGLAPTVNNLSTQVNTLSSQVNTLVGQNLDSRLSTATAANATQQTDINTLKALNLGSRMSLAESNISVVYTSVNRLNGQNLDTRITAAETSASQAKTEVNTIKSQNLNTRIGALESLNLDTRVTNLTSILGAISTADANLINQYNQLNAAVQALQVEISNITGAGVSGITSNSNLFNFIVIQGFALLIIILYLVIRRS